MIPVCVPLLGQKELEYVTNCVKTNWISSKGNYINEFEDRFAKYCGCNYGITTSSGTTALHLALASIGIQKGDEVIVPAFTMIASVLPIIYCGAIPVLVDADRETWNIDASSIEEKITARTRAILPVHIYGHPCEMNPISDMGKRHSLVIVEDAAEAHGAEYGGKKCGGLGDAACFSFYANKIVTCGEGGMVVTNSKAIADRAKSLRNLSFPEGKRIFLHSEVGYNYRMTNLQAAIGLGQLERIEQLAEMRRKNARIYNSLLRDMPGITLPPEKEGVKNVYWMYSILVGREFGVSRDELMDELHKKGVETRPFFIPMHLQPVFRNMGLFHEEKYPVAEELSVRGLNLPSSSGLKETEIRYVCDAIREIGKD